MINVKTGEIKLIDINEKINKDLSEEAFLLTNINSRIKKSYEINGWKYYITKSMEILDINFVITFAFKKSQLEHISLKHFGSLKEEPFNQENELKRCEIHNDWLKSFLGKPHETQVWGIRYNFKWGSITSNYDPRSVQSEIYISYNK